MPEPLKYARYKEMHVLFCQLTERDVPWDMARVWAWENFCVKFTEDDLRTVVAYIKGLAKQKRPHRQLLFRSLISGPESLLFFQEDLAEARVQQRKRVVDQPKAAVLRVTGRSQVDPNDRPARSAADILAGEAAFAQFRALKGEL